MWVHATFIMFLGMKLKLFSTVSLRFPAHRTVLAANTDCPEVRRMFGDMYYDDADSVIVFPDVSAAAMEALVRALYTGRLEAPSEMRSEVMEGIALFNKSLNMLKAFTFLEPEKEEDSEVEKPMLEENKVVVADTSEKIQVDKVTEPPREENMHQLREEPEVTLQKRTETTPQTREDPGSTTTSTQRSKRNRSAVKRFIELDDDDFGQRKRKRSENKPPAAAVKVEETAAAHEASRTSTFSLPKMANRPNFAEAAKGEWRQKLSLLGPLEFLRWLLDNGFLNSAVGPCEECSTPLELTPDPDAPPTDKIRWSCPNRSKSRR